MKRNKVPTTTNTKGSSKTGPMAIIGENLFIVPSPDESDESDESVEFCSSDFGSDLSRGIKVSITVTGSVRRGDGCMQDMLGNMAV